MNFPQQTGTNLFGLNRNSEQVGDVAPHMTTCRSSIILEQHKDTVGVPNDGRREKIGRFLVGISSVLFRLLHTLQTRVYGQTSWSFFFLSLFWPPCDWSLPEAETGAEPWGRSAFSLSPLPASLQSPLARRIAQWPSPRLICHRLQFVFKVHLQLISSSPNPSSTSPAHHSPSPPPPTTTCSYCAALFARSSTSPPLPLPRFDPTAPFIRRQAYPALYHSTTTLRFAFHLRERQKAYI